LDAKSLNIEEIKHFALVNEKELKRELGKKSLIKHILTEYRRQRL
jgi:hypothetical protein